MEQSKTKSWLDLKIWDGESKPPVGTLCKYILSDRISYPVIITGNSKYGVCYQRADVDMQGAEKYAIWSAEKHRFKPDTNHIKERNDWVYKVFNTYFKANTPIPVSLSEMYDDMLSGKLDKPEEK